MTLTWRLPMPPELVSTEKAILGVLMTAPFLRDELQKKYARPEGLFLSREAVKLLSPILKAKGHAYPAVVDPFVADLLDGPWSPQRIFDSTSFDAVEQFWDMIGWLQNGKDNQA